MLRTLRFLAILSIIALSCKTLLPGEENSQSGEVLFQEDFTNPSSGWNQVSAENGITDYDDGAYRIFINETNMDVWARPGLHFTDVVIEVDTFKVGGDRNNRFGIICRASHTNNFYSFIISSDGYFGIGKVKSGIYELIQMEALQQSESILQGSAHNRIRAECVGDKLVLSVNGNKLIEVVDSDYSSGDVGLIAGTYDSVGTDIRFDNFVVQKP